MKSRADALTDKVNESAGDSKKMWNTTRKLLHSKPVTSMSDDECASLSSAFSQFFSDKVARIQHSIADFIKTFSCGPVQTLRSFVGPPLLGFTSVSSAEVVKLIGSMPNKSSPRDVLPMSLLKSCPDEFAPVIAHLTNRSFTDGVFPLLFKTAEVLPLLKKTGTRSCQSGQLSANLQPQHYLEDGRAIGPGPSSTASAGILQF